MRHWAAYVPMVAVVKCAHPTPQSDESVVNAFPAVRPERELDGFMTETMTSLDAVTVTGAPDAVVVADCPFNTSVWSKGETVSRLENSQIMAAPGVPEDNVRVTVVALALLFLAYQRSTAPAVESLA